MLTCSHKESLAVINNNKPDLPCILWKSDPHKRLSIAILNILSVKVSRAACRVLVPNHLKLPLWSCLKALFTAWMTVLGTVEPLYRFIAVVKYPGLFDRSRSHKKYECSTITISANCNMSWVHIWRMSSLTYAKACNLLLNRWSTNLFTCEIQMQIMNNPSNNTHQRMKARLNFLRWHERELQPPRKCKYTVENSQGIGWDKMMDNIQL